MTTQAFPNSTWNKIIPLGVAESSSAARDEIISAVEIPSTATPNSSEENTESRLRMRKALRHALEVGVGGSERDVVGESMQNLIQLLAFFHSESFSDDTRYAFDQSVFEWLNRYTQEAVEAADYLVFHKTIPDDLAGYVLRALGAYVEATTHSQRMELLTSSLFSKASRIRYAATLGLSDASPSTAAAIVAEALPTETNQLVRLAMKSIIE